MPQIDLARIISATRDFLHIVQDHNAFSGKLGYDEARATANLASAAASVNGKLGNRRSDDPVLDQNCDMLRGNVGRLSIEPANPFLLDIVERATAALERIQARREQESEAELRPGKLSPEAPAELPDLVTLDQAAALVNRQPNGLRHYRKKGMPKPQIQGRKGKPNEYLWSEMRPWLEETFGRKIPELAIMKFRTSRENLLDHS
jgi:hypothetical protein